MDGWGSNGYMGTVGQRGGGVCMSGVWSSVWGSIAQTHTVGGWEEVLGRRDSNKGEEGDNYGLKEMVKEKYEKIENFTGGFLYLRSC